MIEYDIWHATFNGPGPDDRTISVIWPHKPGGVDTKKLVDFARRAAARQNPTTSPPTLAFRGIVRIGAAWGTV